MIPLRLSVLCLDCETISPANGCCPCCQSRALLSLARVLGGSLLPAGGANRRNLTSDASLIRRTPQRRPVPEQKIGKILRRKFTEYPIGW